MSPSMKSRADKLISEIGDEVKGYLTNDQRANTQLRQEYYQLLAAEKSSQWRSSERGIAKMEACFQRVQDAVQRERAKWDRLASGRRLGDVEFRKELSAVDTNMGGLHVERSFTRRDLRLAIQNLSKEIKQLRSAGEGDSPGCLQKIGSVGLLLNVGKQCPDATVFGLHQSDGHLEIRPLDYKSRVSVQRVMQSKFTIVGGDLSSVVGAISAAQAGKSVTLIYAGAITGLSSAHSANMRFFDDVQSWQKSPVTKDILENVLGIGNGKLAVPKDADKRILEYLKSHYPSISLVQTKSLNGLRVDKEHGRVSGVTTLEGTKVKSQHYIDCDPEGRFTEKSGVKTSVNGQARLAEGVVFTASGISRASLKQIDKPSNRKTTAEIASIAGLSLDSIDWNALPAFERDHMRHAMKCYEKELQTKPASQLKDASYGYRSLAAGYQLFAACRMIALWQNRGSNTQEESRQLIDLRWLAKRRVVDGFNVAHGETNSHVFNSISYKLGVSVLQGDNALSKDARFRPIQTTERSTFEQYFSLLANTKVALQSPSDFYVRRNSLSVDKSSQLMVDKIEEVPLNKPIASNKIAYPNDLRGVIDKPVDTKLVWSSSEKRTATSVENVHCCSKINLPANIMGATRIVIARMADAEKTVMSLLY
jgi:hypothetical protein